MRTVHAETVVAATVHEAETLWYDTSTWPHWVDGLADVERVDETWPAAGAEVVWQSTPAGRGRVTERVAEHEPLVGQTSEIEDDSVRGRQSISFTPVDSGTEVALTLDYEITRKGVLTPIVDLLFIRGAMQRSLQTTVFRFASQLAAAAAAREA